MVEKFNWYYPQYNFVITRLVGAPTVDDLKDLIREHAQIRGLQPDFKLLQDHREAIIKLSYNDMEDLASFVLSESLIRPKIVATLIKTPLLYGITRMAGAGFEKIGIHIHQPFYVLGEALKWLEIPEDVELPIS